MTIGERIKSIRKQMHLNQEQLAKLIGVKRSVISKYENGFVSITTSQLEKIASALEVDSAIFLDSAVSDEKFNKHNIEYFQKKHQERVDIMMYGSVETAKAFQKMQDTTDQIQEIYNQVINPPYEKKITPPTSVLPPEYNLLNIKGKEETNKYIKYLSTQEKYTTPDKDDE